MNSSSLKNGEARALHIERRDDNVAVLWMDVPAESINTLRESFAEEFVRAMDELEALDGVVAVVLASRKADNFIAGADIKMLKAVKSAAAAAELSHNGQRALERIESSSLPVVAAIHGACLGGGLEVALACRQRVGSSDPKTKLGLPEVQLGLLPGLGGTQRLPRLIGLQAALDLLLTGKHLNARRALKLGLLDEVVPPPIVVEVAAERARRLAEKERGKKRTPIEAVRTFFHAEELTELVLAENPVGRKVVFDQARKRVLSKTHGNYPAPERILDVVKLGLEKGVRRGMQAEAEAFGELAVSPVAAELINIFLATQELKKDRGIEQAGVTARPVTKLGIVGAGLMGGGIAFVSAQNSQLFVRLKDRDDAALTRGLRYVRQLLDERVERRRMTPGERDLTMYRITPTVGYDGFCSAEVVIEAVFEDLELKQQVLKEVEDSGHPEGIFASNTSSIPIAKIAEHAKHPERVVGMHYFSPVHKMPLLEVITTEKTADWVVATCVELGKRQGKTVIVVRDGVGFYTSRILAPYLNEAAFILNEGVPIEKIDNALVGFGFPVGPVALIDEVGIDVAHKVGKIMHSAFGARMTPPETMERLISDERLGRKSKRGFYRYEAGAKGKSVDASVYALLGVEPKLEKTSSEIAQRCVLQMVNEAARCFGDGIVRSARDGDVGAIFGLGFPPFLGGPFRYVDGLGAKEVVRRLRRFETQHGERFEPAPVLVEMAEREQRFYGAQEDAKELDKSPQVATEAQPQG